MTESLAKAQSSVLFNHLVIEKVLEYLELTELKNARLVCKFWNDLGTPFMAEKVDMILEGTRLDDLQQVIGSLRHHSMSTFTDFTVKISSFQSLSKTIPSMWSTIHLNMKYLHLHITTFYAKKDLTQLLLFYLPCLTTLKLVITKHWGAEDTVVVTANESQVDSSAILPNRNLAFFQLAYLGSVSLYGFDDSEGEEFYFPMKWKSFFKRFPALYHIGFAGLSSMDIGEMLDALLLLQKESSPLRLDPTIKSLEILDENVFPQSPNDEHLLKIATLRNEFESIHLEISPFTNSSLFIDLFAKNAGSLKSLRLRRYPHHPSLSMTLTENHLSRVNFLEVSEDLLPTMSFLSGMPSLDKLHIVIRDYSQLNCCNIIYDTENPSRYTHLGVKFLYIEPPLVSTECIKKLSICLPGLETLKIRVNNEMLTEVCAIAGEKDSIVWGNLKNLQITSWDGLTDEGITGISEQVLKFWGGFSSSMEVQKFRNKPFIGDIPGLRSLTIEMWSDYHNHISDWSILYGVLEVRDLQDVTFVRCGITSSCFSSIPIQRKFIVH